MPDNSTHHSGGTLEDWLALAATDWFPAAATSDMLGPPPPRGGPGPVTFHGQIHEVRTVYVPVVVGGPGGPHGMLRA